KKRRARARGPTVADVGQDRNTLPQRLGRRGAAVVRERIQGDVDAIVALQEVEVRGPTLEVDALAGDTAVSQASTQVVAVGGLCKRGRADQQARGGRGPQYSRPDVEGKVIQLVRRGKRTEGQPALVAVAGRRRDIRHGVKNLERKVGAGHTQHAFRVEAFLVCRDHRVVANDAIEASEARRREAVEQGK